MSGANSLEADRGGDLYTSKVMPVKAVSCLILDPSCGVKIITQETEPSEIGPLLIIKARLGSTSHWKLHGMLMLKSIFHLVCNVPLTEMAVCVAVGKLHCREIY